MKKKILVIALVCALGVTMIACGSSTDKDAQSENPEMENNNDENSSKSKDLENELKEMKLNEPFEVKTDNGTYHITMQGAALTDWYRENDGKNVIALKYEVENVDFKIGELSDGKDGCLIDRNVFKVSTPDGYILNMWNATMSDYGFPDIVEPGFKAKEEIPYIVDEVPAYVNVIFYRNEGDVAQIKIDVTQ